MKKFIISLAALILSLAASAQQSQPIPIDPSVRIGKLENGLTYYIRHNEEPKGQANFYIAQKVGSILEDENQRGLAHFLEHMCFNGTEHFPGNRIVKYCESIGVKFGENLNAYTSIDETVYNIDNVPIAKIPSAVDSCLWILHDWADGLLLEDDDIDHERGVIHEEWRQSTNAQMRMIETLLPAMYPDGNRYALRMPIGLMSVVDNFPYQVLRDYYEKWYRPDQQGIVVVGDFDVDEMEAKIRDIFGTIAKPENPAERVYYEVPDNAEPIVALAKDKEQTNAIGMIFLKHDAYPVELRSDLNYLVYDYAVTAAAVMLNDRLAEMVQTQEPPFLMAQVYDGEYFLAKTKSAVNAEFVSSEAGFAKAMTTVYRELLRAVRGGFTATEYERAKAKILAEFESAYNSRDKKKSAEYCREYVRHFIDNEPIAGAENEYALAQQLSAVIPVEAINQMFASLAGQGSLVACGMLPDKDGISYPTDAEMKAMMEAVAAEEIAPYVDQVSDEPLMSELPESGRIVKEKPSRLGYTEYKLSNGATVYFRHTDFDADEVIMSASSRGGSSLYKDADIPNLKVADELMVEGGIGKFGKTELVKILAGKKVKVKPSISQYSESVSASSTVKDVETMFQLNYLYFTSLRRDEDAFASWKSRTAAALANRESDPMNALVDSLRATITTNPLRSSGIKSAELEKVDYDRVLQIARERFANAADFTFIITGAVTEEAVKPLIEKYIASLPAGGKKEKANLKVLDYKPGQNSNSFERGMATPMVTNVFFDFSNAKYTLKNNLAFDLALSSLTVVLLDEIREKEGGTYGIGAYGDLEEGPKGRSQAYMQIVYQTDPEKYEYLNGRVREIVAAFAKEGPAAENLAKGKEFLAKKHKENIAENSYWAGCLADLLETGVDRSADFEAVLESITAEDVRASFAAMLKAANHSEIIMVGTAK